MQPSTSEPTRRDGVPDGNAHEPTPSPSPPRGQPSRPRRQGVQLPPTPRNIAAEVVARVDRDGAFAAAVLDHELSTNVGLASRDKALATELVYGTLRLRLLLEQTIERATPRGIMALDARTKAILLVATYQIHFTRIPAFASVSEAVEAIRATKGRILAGFANGALRRVAAMAEKEPLPQPPGVYRDAAAPWLRRALERSIGDDATAAFLCAGPWPPPTDLRVRSDRDGWIEKLRAARPDADIEPGRLAERAIHVRGGGDPRTLPGWAEGAFAVQEEGSQAIAALLGALPSDLVLDACAGRGNKTSALMEPLVLPDGTLQGRVDAADLHPDKLSRLSLELDRLKLPRCRTFGVDWSVGKGDLQAEAYDRVLVDAPCSGTGTIRRRPEIHARRQPADLASLAALQTTIVCNATDVLKPGGRLLYAVCSVLRDEAEAVVAAVMARRADLEPAPLDGPLAARAFGAGATCGRLLTHVHGTDGYFVAAFQKRA